MLNGLLHHEEEPIVALASGQGASAIAILRISGKDCHKLLLPCLKKKGNKPWEINYQSLCDLYDPQTGTVLDEVMVTLFRAPHSYTGQDAAEIFTHGSPYIIQTVLKLFYSLGFRHAEPGEFTRRAYLSGKIDLSEAEGIHGLISAASHQQWLAARQLYTGTLKKLVDTLTVQLTESLAWLEASIDFPEEDDTSQIQRDQILSRVQKVDQSLKDLLRTYSSGKIASQGLSVALFGKPNVGKSTLMNTLLNSERAIVTDIPGTTRDYLEEPCLINGRLIRLIDTAGIRKTSGVIENIGIERTYEIARSADLVLFLSEKDSSKVQNWINEIKPRNCLVVSTKADLKLTSPKSLVGGPSTSLGMTEDSLGMTEDSLGMTEDSLGMTRSRIAISCHTGEGIETLKQKIQEIADQYLEPLHQDQAFITSARHKDAVEGALKTLDTFFKAFDEGAYDEFLAFELHQTAKQLRSIVGEVSTDDILDIVFSSFCVGK